MKRSNVRFAVGSLIIVCAAAILAGQVKMQAPTDPESLEHMAARTASLEQWADRIARDSYLQAAREFRAGRVKDGVARLSATVTVERFIPDPKSLNVCFETCLSYGQSGALSCYVNCNAPRPPNPLGR